VSRNQPITRGTTLSTEAFLQRLILVWSSPQTKLKAEAVELPSQNPNPNLGAMTDNYYKINTILWLPRILHRLTENWASNSWDQFSKLSKNKWKPPKWIQPSILWASSLKQTLRKSTAIWNQAEPQARHAKFHQLKDPKKFSFKKGTLHHIRRAPSKKRGRHLVLPMVQVTKGNQTKIWSNSLRILEGPRLQEIIELISWQRTSNQLLVSQRVMALRELILKFWQCWSRNKLRNKMCSSNSFLNTCKFWKTRFQWWINKLKTL
jgi:hypothetical protein